MKVYFRYFEEADSAYECSDCKVYDNIVVLTGVKGEDADEIRVPLFKVKRMDKYLDKRGGNR